MGARTAPSAEAGRAAVAHDLAGERTQGGERALQRARVDPVGAPASEEGAQVGGREIGEFGDARRRAEPLGEEGEKLARVAPIGLDRVGRKPPLAGEPPKPGRDDRRQIGRGGQGGGFQRFRHGAMMRQRG